MRIFGKEYEAGVFIRIRASVEAAGHIYLELPSLLAFDILSRHLERQRNNC
jgi:hypothetical protein